MPDTNKVQQVLNDPNFYALPPGERVKVLFQLDSNFSALPAEEQLKVASREVQQPPPAMPATSPQRSIFQRAYVLSAVFLLWAGLESGIYI